MHQSSKYLYHSIFCCNRESFKLSFAFYSVPCRTFFVKQPLLPMKTEHLSDIKHSGIFHCLHFRSRIGNFHDVITNGSAAVENSSCVPMENSTAQSGERPCGGDHVIDPTMHFDNFTGYLHLWLKKQCICIINMYKYACMMNREMNF